VAPASAGAGRPPRPYEPMNSSGKKVRDLARALPFPLKQGLKHAWGLVPVSTRYGRAFGKTRALLRSSRGWNREQVTAFQNHRLRRCLEDAYDGVPYYRGLFDRIGIGRERLSDPAIIREIPFLTREEAHKHHDRLLDRRAERRGTLSITTGGTTGRQLKIVTRPEHRAAEAAFVFDLWGRIGVRPNSRRAVLRGAVVKTGGYRKTWRYDPLRKELLLSVYDLTDDNLELYLGAMRKYRTAYLHCYPSAVLALARFLAQRPDLRPPRLDAVLTSSENIYPRQREFIESNLGARCFDLYGQTEQVALGGACESGGLYHFYPQYGYTEIVDDKGRPVTEDGGEGEIVATGFINTTMPFIRYRTGDRARLRKTPCACGRPYLLLEAIRGRWEQEVLIGKTGNIVSLTAVNSHSRIYDRVRQYQFSQKSPGLVTLTIVPDRGYGEQDTVAIRGELTGKLGESLRLEIVFTDAIARTARGKFPFLVQHLTAGESPGAGE